MGDRPPHPPGPLYETLNGMVLHALFIASESVTGLTNVNPHDSCRVESTESVDAMTTPGTAFGRFTESMNATILLVFDPRNP
jgi:hypothetical protein